MLVCQTLDFISLVPCKALGQLVHSWACFTTSSAFAVSVTCTPSAPSLVSAIWSTKPILSAATTMVSPMAVALNVVLDWTHLKNQKWDNRGRTTGAIWERRKRGHASLGTSWHHPAIGNIRRCHQALAWILGPWFLSWRHFWHVLLGPRDSISNIFFLITRWVISSLWILSPKPFAVFYILHCFYRGVKPGILSRALWSQTSWILSQILA